jgi:hypothetical protein
VLRNGKARAVLRVERFNAIDHFEQIVVRLDTETGSNPGCKTDAPPFSRIGQRIGLRQFGDLLGDVFDALA